MFFTASRPACACSQACCHSCAWHSRFLAIEQVFSAVPYSPVNDRSRSIQNPPSSALTPIIPSGHAGAAELTIGFSGPPLCTAPLPICISLIMRLAVVLPIGVAICRITLPGGTVAGTCKVKSKFLGFAT